MNPQKKSAIVSLSAAAAAALVCFATAPFAALGETRHAVQHEIPEMEASDIQKAPRSVVIISVCGRFAKMYFVTSDGRQVKFSAEGHKVSAPEAFDALARAALFELMEVQGDFCPSDKKKADGITDL